MIKINFQEPDTDNWKAWKAQCEQEQEEHNVAIEAGHEDEVKKDIYDGKRFNIKSDIYRNIEGPFNGKCAYCESNIASDQDVEIDHFRPKNAVSDIDFNPVRFEEDGETRDHPGYYWLCYDYKNLLPSCILCNQKRLNNGKPTGKFTRFPVEGQHARRPGEEENESPLLVNPVFEDPTKYLELDKMGIFHACTDKGQACTNRGQACIDIFGLNRRQALVENRKGVYNNVKNDVNMLTLHMAKQSNEVQKRLSEVKDVWKGKVAYSVAGILAIKERSPFLIDIFELGDIA